MAATSAPSRRGFNPSGWLDLQGWIQVLAVNHEQDGLVIDLIALLTSYDHISLPAGAALYPRSHGASGSSLPRWRPGSNARR